MKELKRLIEAARDRADHLDARMSGIFLDRAVHAIEEDEEVARQRSDERR